MKMAQKTEKEGTEFKVVHETTPLCINTCGVTGNPATNNLCQKSPRSTIRRLSPGTPRSDLKKHEDWRLIGDDKATIERLVASLRREVNRCSGCRRKVGLTGFRCRCGEHRYSDRHDCSYDYSR